VATQRASVEAVWLRPGPAANSWLLRRIQELQAGDPLRPVAVLVPSHHAGLHLRRRLAAAGYAGVRFTVLGQLTEALAAEALAAAGRTPLTAVTRDALLRAALRSAGGPLAGAADQAGLVALVARLAADLRRRAGHAPATPESWSSGTAPPGSPSASAPSTATSRAVFQVVEAYQRRRTAHRLYDGDDLLAGAVQEVESGLADGVLGELGAVIVFLPVSMDASEARLLGALATRTRLTVALSTIDPGPGGALELAALGLDATAAHPPAPAAAATVTVVINPDPIEEVRSAVRGALAAMEGDDPVPLHRQAIVYRDEETYGQALRDTLRAAGIPPVALGGRPLLESVAARGLLGLIRLRDQRFSRSACLAWLSGMPHQGGDLPSQARWDQLSRDAGVVRGAEAWRVRLDGLAEERSGVLAQLDADLDDPAAEARSAALRRDIEDAHRIAQEISSIEAATAPPRQGTWPAHVDWALGLLGGFLEPHRGWSAEEREARQMVEEVVRGLAAAALLEPSVSLPLFLRTLEDALRGRRRPEGRLGSGVVIGPHSLLLGMDLDRVHILGTVEPAFPAAFPVDPLLPGDPLDRRREHETRERREWLVALAAAGREAVVSAPLVDSEGRAAYPSPWLLELLADGGPPPPATAVREGNFAHPRLRRDGPGDPQLPDRPPLHLSERREREAARAHRSGSDLGDTALARRADLPLGRALNMARARRSSRLSEFDGNLAAVRELPFVARGLGGAAQSATGIQTWATCPFHFLLGRLLVVAPTEDVEDERWWQVDAAEKGSLIHRILERFFAEVVASGHPGPGVAYSAADVARMEAIAAGEFERLAGRGAAGHPLVWDNELSAILTDLRTLLRIDAEQRAAAGWMPSHLEQPFGIDAEPGSWPAVTVALQAGRSLSLCGYIDRVDQAPGRFRVIDYKTGRDTGAAVSAENRLNGGRALQLPIYGRSVRDRVRERGEPAPPTAAQYWFCTERGDFKQREITVDGAVEAALDGVLADIDAGVRAGCFPQVPGEFHDHFHSFANCAYCDYDSLCPAGRDSLAAAKAGDPATEPHRSLQPEPAEVGG